MEEARAKSGEPVQLLNAMMPRMGAPQCIRVMLRAMDPIDDEIHQHDCHQYLDRAWQRLDGGDRWHQKLWRDRMRNACPEFSADSVYQNRHPKGEQVDLQ